MAPLTWRHARADTGHVSVRLFQTITFFRLAHISLFSARNCAHILLVRRDCRTLLGQFRSSLAGTAKWRKKPAGRNRRNQRNQWQAKQRLLSHLRQRPASRAVTNNRRITEFPLRRLQNGGGAFFLRCREVMPCRDRFLSAIVTSNRVSVLRRQPHENRNHRNVRD